MARSDTLQCVGDEVACPSLRLGARLLLHLTDAPCELVPDEILGALEQAQLRLVHRHARDPLELGELLLACLLVLVLELPEMRLAVGEALLAPRDLRQLGVDLLLLGEHTLLDLDDPRAVLCDLTVDLRPELDSFLTRRDLGLAPERLRLALRVVEQELALLPRFAEPRLSEVADGDGSSQSPDDHPDQYPDCDQHGQLLGRLSAALPRRLPGSPAGTGTSRICETSRHLGSKAVG